MSQPSDNPKQLVAEFTVPDARQADVVDGIHKEFTMLMEDYSNSSIGFGRPGRKRRMPRVSKNKADPEAVVQRQLEAYNARNIAAFMATYAKDAQQFEHPSKLLASGAAQIRERSIGRFKEPNLHALLNKRIVMGNIVIDHETVTRTFPEGPGTLELVAIYEVQKGKIASAWFIFGAKTLDAPSSG